MTQINVRLGLQLLTKYSQNYRNPPKRNYLCRYKQVLTLEPRLEPPEKKNKFS